VLAFGQVVGEVESVADRAPEPVERIHQDDVALTRVVEDFA
jgi:hypothetical protein